MRGSRSDRPIRGLTKVIFMEKQKLFSLVVTLVTVIGFTVAVGGAMGASSGQTTVGSSADIGSAAASSSGLATQNQANGTIQAADASGFPTIQTFVNINTTAGRNGNLTMENFSVQEDGVSQSINSVSFTSNQSATTLDIVYVFDRSNSMGDEINDLRRQIKNVSQQLNESGRDVRFGLVTFEDNTRFDQNLTSNVTDLENALDAVSVSGGDEYNYNAIHDTLQMDFRPGAQKVLVDITDEDDEGGSSSEYNQSQIATELQQKGVGYVAVSPASTNGGPDLDKKVLANESGGEWYDISGVEFTAIVNDITDRLATTYIVEYETSNQIRRGNERVVNVTVDDPNEGRVTALGQYIPPQVDIIDVDTGGFPTINATMDVNTTAGNNGNLDLSNFNLSEDGSEQQIQDLRFDSTNETWILEYTTPDPEENGTQRRIAVTTSLESGGNIVVTERYKAPGTPFNLLPVPNISISPEEPSVGETITLDGSNSADPDGTVAEYKWDLDGDGVYDDANGPTVTTDFSSAGNPTVGLMVVDDEGGTNTTTRSISIASDDSEDIIANAPGFGVVIAVLALVTVTLLARRRT